MFIRRRKAIAQGAFQKLKEALRDRPLLRKKKTAELLCKIILNIYLDNFQTDDFETERNQCGYIENAEKTMEEVCKQRSNFWEYDNEKVTQA